MMSGNYVIQFNHGVLIYIKIQFEQKHYTMEDLTTGGELLAQKLGGHYLYFNEDNDEPTRT